VCEKLKVDGLWDGRRVDDASSRGVPFLFFFSPAKQAFPRDVNHSRMAAAAWRRGFLVYSCSPLGSKSFFLVVFLQSKTPGNPTLQSMVWCSKVLVPFVQSNE